MNVVIGLRTEHLQPFERRHAQDEILLCQVENLNLLRNVPDDSLRLCGLLANPRHLSEEVLRA